MRIKPNPFIKGLNTKNKRLRSVCYLTIVGILSACGGGESGDNDNKEETSSNVITHTIAPFDEGPNNEFGTWVTVLESGKVLIGTPSYDGEIIKSDNLYIHEPTTQRTTTLLLGAIAKNSSNKRISELSNGDILISSLFEYSYKGTYVGSITIIPKTQNGYDTANLITMSGDNDYDQLGSGGITELSNGDIAISSPNDNINNVKKAGSVTLIKKNNGKYDISNAVVISGNNEADQFSSHGIKELSNGDIAIVTPFDKVNNVDYSGSITIIKKTPNGYDKASPIVIGGDNKYDKLGYGGITELSNGDIAISSPFDDVDNIENAGSVILLRKSVNGYDTANTIVISGDNKDDKVSYLKELSNGSIAISSYSDDIGDVTNAGSITFIKKTPAGFDIKNPIKITGDNYYDNFGEAGATELSNGNILIKSPSDTVDNKSNSGSLTLVGPDFSILKTIAGSKASAELGANLVEFNDNYIAFTQPQNSTTKSVTITDNTLTVKKSFDVNFQRDLSSHNAPIKLVKLKNGNLVVSSNSATVNTIKKAGRVMLIDGITLQVIRTYKGDTENDQLGSTIITLNSGHFIIQSKHKTIGGLANAGSILTIDGKTGEILNTIQGKNAGDIGFLRIGESPEGSFVAVGIPSYDNNGIEDAGRVEIISLQ